MPINIVVQGEPQSCYDAADGMDKTAQGTKRNGDAIAKAKQSSESCWPGTAGQAFRANIATTVSDADRVDEQAVKTAQALRTFGDDLTTVKARMQQARTVAASAGLPTTEASIADPGPEPQFMGPLTLDEMKSAQAMKDQHNKQVQAANEARQIVEEARSIEKAMHQKAQQAAGPVPSTIDTIRTVSTTVVGNTLATVKGFHSEAKTMFERGGRVQNTADRLQEIATDERLDNARRAKAGKAAETFQQGADRENKGGRRFEKPVKKIPKSLRDGISANPGDLMEDSTGILKVGSKIAKGIPYAGTLLSLGSSGVEVAEGQKSAVQAGTEAGFSLGGAAVSGAAAGEAGAIACAPLGPVGSGTCGLVAGLGGGLLGGIGGKDGADAIFGWN